MQATHGRAFTASARVRLPSAWKVDGPPSLHTPLGMNVISSPLPFPPLKAKQLVGGEVPTSSPNPSAKFTTRSYCGGLRTFRSARDANCRIGLLVVTTVTLPSLADFLSVDHGAACFDGVMGCSSDSSAAPLSYVLASAKRLCSVSCSLAAFAARSLCRKASGSSSGFPLRTTCAHTSARLFSLAQVRLCAPRLSRIYPFTPGVRWHSTRRPPC